MGVAIPPEELDGLSLQGPASLFLGVSTAASAVHRYFARWAGNFPEPVRLIGVDLPVAAPRRRYQDLLDWIARNRQIRGMVITSHKIDLFRAGSSRFAAADRLSATLGEISALRRTPSGDLLAYATDPLSARAAAAELNLGTSGGEIICFGAGGAAVALLAALTLPETELTRETQLTPDASCFALGASAPGDPLNGGDIHVTDVLARRLAISCTWPEAWAWPAGSSRICRRAHQAIPSYWPVIRTPASSSMPPGSARTARARPSPVRPSSPTAVSYGT